MARSQNDDELNGSKKEENDRDLLLRGILDVEEEGDQIREKVEEERVE